MLWLYFYAFPLLLSIFICVMKKKSTGQSVTCSRPKMIYSNSFRLDKLNTYLQSWLKVTMKISTALQWFDRINLLNFHRLLMTKSKRIQFRSCHMRMWIKEIVYWLSDKNTLIWIRVDDIMLWSWRLLIKFKQNSSICFFINVLASAMYYWKVFFFALYISHTAVKFFRSIVGKICMCGF